MKHTTNIFVNRQVTDSLFYFFSYFILFTARKCSLRRLCFYMCLSVHRGYPSMHCRSYPIMLCNRSPQGVVSQHAFQVSRPTPTGEVEGSGLGGFPGPHPGRKLRGLAWGVSRPTPRGVSQHALRQTPPADGYCCGWYASYWNAFLFISQIFLE